MSAALTGCPDDGHRVDLCANPALDCDDGDACTADSCDSTAGCVNARIGCNDGDACTADSCNPASGCVNARIDCDDRNACTTDGCNPARGCVNTDISASCDDRSACTTDSCNPASGCVNSAVACDDGNECTADACNPASGCASTPVADGTACDRGLGRCAGGVCEPVGCGTNSECNDSDACTMDRCNLETRQCVNTDVSASCNDGNACTQDGCAPATGCTYTDISSSCSDGKECTADSCVPATGCRSVPVTDGTSCNDGAGECRSGSCFSLATVEYRQDFEAMNRANPTALADDGWVVYGNVFDGATMAYLYGYGPFGAPNDGAAFCAVAANQGGTGQGSQQLSVYNDYNNTDHANGRAIESNVYRERSLTADDVGRTISFSFDAKRGNINDPANPLCPCSSTAVAFIKTLNPAAGFATTNFVRRETSALPDEWGRYKISLPIGAGLVDQLLQVGFSTTATLYQPSGNFYDNIEVGSAPTTP